MKEIEKLIHVAFVDYFLLMQKVDNQAMGWTEEHKSTALEILDQLMIDYANKIKQGE